jgi:hypothetical protein
MGLKAEAIGGWATAAALFVGIITFVYTYGAQERFNTKQLQMMTAANDAAIKGLQLQKEAADTEKAAAKAQLEAAAVEALGNILQGASADNRAWAASEAIIDLVGDQPEWQATARRALKHHPGNLLTIECELYSKPFQEFAAKTFEVSVTDLCAHRVRLPR